MNAEEIKKKLASIKTTKLHSDSPRIVLQFSNSYNTLILPYKKGAEVLASLEDAERYSGNWGEAPKLEQLGGSMNFSFMPASEYELIRQAVLLNMTVEDIKQALES